jgi:hypothetical protein
MAGSPDSAAVAINEMGRIAGSSEIRSKRRAAGGQASHAVLWTKRNR